MVKTFQNPKQTVYHHAGIFKTQKEAEEEVSRLNPDPLYRYGVYNGLNDWYVIGKSISTFPKA